VDYQETLSAQLRRNPSDSPLWRKPQIGRPDWPPAAEPGLEAVNPEDWVPSPKALLAKTLPALAGTFIGARSRASNVENVIAALRREKAGASPAQIWDELHTGRHELVPGRPWMQEIPDKNSSFVGFQGGKTDGTVGEAFNAPRLYEAYPSLKGTELVMDPKLSGRGEMRRYVRDPQRMQIALNPDRITDAGDIRSTLLHEIGGHGVANIEGWPIGTKPNYSPLSLDALPQKAKELIYQGAQFMPRSASIYPNKDGPIAAVETILKHGILEPGQGAQYQSLLSYLQRKQHTLKKQQYQTYLDDPGEAMARMVQYRRNDSPDYLRAQYPFDPTYFKEATGSSLDDVVKQLRGQSLSSPTR
jgi:hypothetical protein